MWKRVSKEACSEDEAFEINGRLHYKKIRPAWRSAAPDVESWFRTFDHLYMSTRFQNDGKRKPGRLPGHRHPASGPRVSDPKDYPKGLPKNLYDKTWLATLDGFERKQLRAQRPIKLIFDNNIYRYVELFR